MPKSRGLFLQMPTLCLIVTEVYLAMSFSLNGTYSPENNRVPGKVMGSRSFGCMLNIHTYMYVCIYTYITMLQETHCIMINVGHFTRIFIMKANTAKARSP